MTKEEVLQEIISKENPNGKKVYLKHGAREPFYGVRVEDLKKIQKKIKKDYLLAKELFDTGISDAMYLAGLIADEKQMTKSDLNQWAENAYWYMLSEYTVPWVASETPFGWELGLEWIDSDRENIASSGWATLSGIVSLKANSELDIPILRKLLSRVAEQIHKSPNRVRFTMNNFVIAVAAYVSELSSEAMKIAEKIGVVKVDMGGSACKVPYAPEYIINMHKRGTLDKKRKDPRC